MKRQSILLCVSLGFALMASAQTVPRMAFLNDASASKDADDICAIPMQAAIMAAYGATDKLVHWSYNCDYGYDTVEELYGPSKPGHDRQAELEESVLGALDIWGDASHGEFRDDIVFNLRNSTQRTDAITHLAAQINASSSSDLLYIIEAGEPDIIGDALLAANQNKRQYVRVVTHHQNNDGGAFWHLVRKPTEKENISAIPGMLPITDFVIGHNTIPNETAPYVEDQNGRLKKPVADYPWLTSSTDPRIQFLHERYIASTTDNWNPTSGTVDPSDAGMVWFVINIANSTRNPTPTDIGNLLTTWVAAHPMSNLSSPWKTADVGAVAASGSVTANGSAWTINGSGADIWGKADEFRYVYQDGAGNCNVVAKVTSLQNTHAWAKAGVMIRESMDANARSVMMCVSPSNGVSFQYRSATGGTTVNSRVTGQTAPKWLKIVRSSNSFTGSYSNDGTTWTQVGTTQNISMGSATKIGVAVTSHLDGTLCTATMEGVNATP